jgi:general stress protein YciG
VLRIAAFFMATNKFISAYMREIGKKGGKSSGAAKKRPKEHYREMARKRWAKAKKATTCE